MDMLMLTLFLGFCTVALIGYAVTGLLTPLPFLAFLLQKRLRPPQAPSGSRLGRTLERGMRGLPGTPSVFWWTWFWTCVNWGVKLLAFAWILGMFTSLPYGTALLGSLTGEVSSVMRSWAFVTRRVSGPCV